MVWFCLYDMPSNFLFLRARTHYFFLATFMDISKYWLKILSFVTMTWCKIDSKCFLTAVLKESDESKSPTHKIWTFYLQWMFIWKRWRHKEKARKELIKLHWVKNKAKTHNGDYYLGYPSYIYLSDIYPIRNDGGDTKQNWTKTNRIRPHVGNPKVISTISASM